MIFNKDKMKSLSESEKKAKMTALKEAHGMASDMLKHKVKGLKKVTIASDSEEGIKKGIEKAGEAFGMRKSEDQDMDESESEDQEMGEQESEDQEMGERDEAEASEYEDQQEESQPMSVAKINAKIEELMKLKEKLSK